MKYPMGYHKCIIICISWTTQRSGWRVLQIRITMSICLSDRLSIEMFLSGNVLIFPCSEQFGCVILKYLRGTCIIIFTRHFVHLTGILISWIKMGTLKKIYEKRASISLENDFQEKIFILHLKLSFLSFKKFHDKVVRKEYFHFCHRIKNQTEFDFDLIVK